MDDLSPAKFCYGKHYKRPECEQCEISSYCHDAADRKVLVLDYNAEIDGRGTAHVDHDYVDPDDTLRYTRRDMQDFALALLYEDKRLLAYIADIFESPGSNLSDLSRKHNISRQAVSQFVKRLLYRRPEFSFWFSRLQKPQCNNNPDAKGSPFQIGTPNVFSKKKRKKGG